MRSGGADARRRALLVEDERCPVVREVDDDRVLVVAVVEAQLEDRSEEDLLAPHAVKRMLEPSEVAAAASFLLGPDGRAVTGAPLVLDLGWTAR